MAAAQAAMRNFLGGIIGIADSTGANVHDRRDAVRDEGMETIDDLAEFDEEDVKNLCASVRKPGGMIEDPNNATKQIANPGHSIPAIAEKRLKLACYGARIYRLLGRAITADGLNRDRLKLFEQHQATVKDHQEPENLPPVSKTFGIMKALDVLPNYLSERIGNKKISLVYVIRDNEAPEPLRGLENNCITSEN